MDTIDIGDGKTVSGDVMARVANGVRYLSLMQPDWRTEITIDKLDMGHASTDVVGQLKGDYYAGIAQLGIHADEEAYVLGLVLFPPESGLQSKYDELTDAWRYFLEHPEAINEFP